jgi:putative transposase
MDECESFIHSKWECKYHVFFIPKCRHKTLYEGLRQHLGEVFRHLAEQKQCRIEKCQLMSDHVYMMISIPPKFAISEVVGFIKNKSAIHVARVYGERKQNIFGQHLWARDYMVFTGYRDETVIREYIRNLEAEDKLLDQLTLWKWAAAGTVARPNRGRVSEPAQATLRGVHPNYSPALQNKRKRDS